LIARNLGNKDIAMIVKRRGLITGLLASPLAAPALIGCARADMPTPVCTGYVPDLPSSPVSAAPGPVPRWKRFAVPARKPDGRPVITLVIDDLGVVHAGTQRALALPAPITLAWFPFARNLPDQVAAGAARGHEALLHMPMQAHSNSTAQTGPDPLRIDLPAAENMRRLVAAIEAVPDTVGLNNHMGSVATRDVALMNLVAQEARRRDMLFLDSLTIDHSVAWQQAELAGVPTASRDVFIDNAADTAQIAAQLAQTEHVARRMGHVIAIGHPRPLTLDALEAWMPTLAGKGFMLWPLSATVAWRNEIELPTV
jgi:uncharacterized protein